MKKIRCSYTSKSKKYLYVRIMSAVVPACSESSNWKSVAGDGVKHTIQRYISFQFNSIYIYLAP